MRRRWTGMLYSLSFRSFQIERSTVRLNIDDTCC